MATSAAALLSVSYTVAGTAISGNLSGRFTTPANFTRCTSDLSVLPGAIPASRHEPPTVSPRNRGLYGTGSNPAVGGPGSVHLNRVFLRFLDAPFGQWQALPLGNLVGTTVRRFELWNSFNDTSQTLTAETVDGGSGVSVTDTYGLPETFLPHRGRIYTATISIEGPPLIANELVFTFTGLSAGSFGAPPSGTIRGVRLVPFTFEPDWSAPVTEGWEFATDVFTAHDGSEQRRQLRAYPRRHIGFQFGVTETEEVGYLRSLLYGWLAQRYGVLAWYDVMHLTANAAEGDTVIYVETTADRDMVAGQTLLLRRDVFTYEAHVIDSFDATSITFVDQLLGAWTTADVALPVFNGSLDPSQPIERLSNRIATAQVAFLCEARV